MNGNVIFKCCSNAMNFALILFMRLLLHIVIIRTINLRSPLLYSPPLFSSWIMQQNSVPERLAISLEVSVPGPFSGRAPRFQWPTFSPEFAGLDWVWEYLDMGSTSSVHCYFWVSTIAQFHKIKISQRVCDMSQGSLKSRTAKDY